MATPSRKVKRGVGAAKRPNRTVTRARPGVIAPPKSNGTGPVTKVMTITPEMAESWLASNTHNRPLRERHITNLQEAIDRGEWKFNGDAIRFDDQGQLLDGQHRLWAIALSGTAVEALVITGLPTDTQYTMDFGKRRNLADALRINGYASALSLAATINLKWRLDSGQIRTTQVSPTVQQGLAHFNVHPDLEEALKLAGRYHRRLHGSTAVVAVAYYEFANKDPEAADEFFERLIEGTELTKGSPILALRRQIETNIDMTKSQPMFLALLIKAWNAYVEGRKVENIYWRPVGKQAEQFPEIRG